MLARTQALEGGANVTCISKVQSSYHSFIRFTILATMLRLVSKPRFSVRVLRPAKRDEKIVQPCSLSNKSSILGSGYLSRTVILFHAW